MEFDHDVLARMLPYLRRYARALIGNQSAADSAVLATINAMAQAPALETPPSLRVYLYKRFTLTINSPIGRLIAESGEGHIIKPGVERRLSAIPPLVRQAFLLGHVEGFTNPQICQILAVNSRQLKSLQDQATKTMIEQTATTVMIIEDELFVATDLEDIMLELGHDVVAIERTHETALKAYRQHRPKLILADIQLADGSSGIDAANDVLKYAAVPVIFVTAYPERLLTGLRPEPAFVLTKPFRANTVKAIVTQALFFDTIARRPDGVTADPNATHAQATAQAQLGSSEKPGNPRCGSDRELIPKASCGTWQALKRAG